ncbi:acyltransferase family protein [Glycocaulis sp.]|uniref:acyltransferase family protein n=1 Tax=Glycocaulis sp. TaxID=1969725 RepID=UPI003D250E0C
MSVPNWFGALTSGGHGRLEDHSNNFTAIRIGFAFLVLCGHAVMLSLGLPVMGFWEELIDKTVHFALDGFFILSGYMIAASLMRSTDMTNYALSRVLRIFPGLIVAALLLWLVVGPLFSNLGPASYFAQAETWTFPLIILSQVDPHAGLPGVFSDHPMGQMNGPLWTIRYELLAYIAAGFLAVAGVFRRTSMVLLLLVAAGILSIAQIVQPWEGIGAATVDSSARFGGAFIIGVAFFALRDRIALTPLGCLVAILAAIVFSGTPAAMITGQLAVGYVTLWAGFLRVPGRVGTAVREVEDVSYGVYILHWPIGQVTLALIPAAGPLGLLAVMAPAALLAGWMMRVWVEKPALALKPRIRSLFKLGNKHPKSAALHVDLAR